MSVTANPAKYVKIIRSARHNTSKPMNPIAMNSMLPIPELSEERRKELVKIVKQMAEEARVRVRSSRREGIDKIKGLQKAGEITEDEMHRNDKEIQNTTDRHIKTIDDHVEKKENEIMTV